jgi:hypothetical protein
VDREIQNVEGERQEAVRYRMLREKDMTTAQNSWEMCEKGDE